MSVDVMARAKAKSCKVKDILGTFPVNPQVVVHF